MLVPSLPLTPLTIDALLRVIAERDAEVALLKHMVDKLKLQLARRVREQYGRSSEQLDAQLTLIPAEAPKASAASTAQLVTLSNESATAGPTQGGFSRYFAGSATWRTAVTTIASATGHQCSPRAAWTGVTGAAAAGFRPGVIPHCARVSRSPSVRAPLSGRQGRPCLP